MATIEEVKEEPTDDAVVVVSEDKEPTPSTATSSLPAQPPSDVSAATETTTTTTVPDDGWKELMGKDLLMKTLRQPAPGAGGGTGAIGINHTDVVLVDFVGRAAATPNDADGPAFIEANDRWVVVGDKDVLPGLELAVRFARVGEAVAVWSHSKFAYGAGTRRYGDHQSLPPNSNVLYHVTIKKLATPDERAQQPLQWLLNTCESKKNISNDAYAHEWSDGLGKPRIKYLYEKAAKELAHYIDTYQPPPPPPQNDQTDNSSDETQQQQQQQQLALLEQAKTLLVDCLNNIVAVHLRAKEYRAAKEAAVRVLQRDENNFKALIRAAKAALLDPASSYEEAEAALQAAAEKKAEGGGGVSQKEEKELEQLRSDFKRRKQAYRQRSKQMYSKAMGGTSNSNTRSGKDATTTTTTPSSNANKDETKNAFPDSPTWADGDTTTKKPFSWSDRSTWPWSTILAHAFQLILPFVVLKAAQYMRAEQHGNNPNPSDTFRPRPPTTNIPDDSTPGQDEF